MTDADLDKLERDVAQARARIAGGLARLRSPENFARFKDDLWAEARETKDDLVDKAREAAVPPIATLLIGAGLFGLVRTPAPQHSGEPYMGLRDEDPAWRRTGDGDLAQRATEMAGAVKDKVQDWSAGAQETARTATTQIADKAASVAESASQTLHDVRATARETFVQSREGAASLAESASVRVRQAMPDREDRDKLLLGAAGRSAVR